jgi:ubiquinone/menaquinone biosynthesis C-methylase UbiE
MFKIRALLNTIILAATILPACALACAQNTASDTQETQRKTSEPYTGDLSIFESPGREDRLQINRVMDILAIVPGKSVADIGAGSGWFTVRAARRVSASGEVYAVDINPEAIQYIDNRIQKEQLPNVKTILSKPDDPLLPANSIDAVLLLKTYHEIAHPITLLKNLRPALRPNARIGIIDRNGNGADHGIGREVVIREAKEAGFRLLNQYDFVKADKMDYFLIFSTAR